MRNDPALSSSYRFCLASARREARNFYLAFRLLPRDRRHQMCALYAFMRHTDDLADEPGEAALKVAALTGWRAELDAALAGRATSWRGMPALVHTVEARRIPERLLHDVIDGVAMDLDPRGFSGFPELADYCHHVASAVGLCCIHIWGYRSDGGRAERLARSCGLALQLTNIIRDVREDARGGRIYLPRDEMTRFGVSPADLDVERPGAALKQLLAFQARRTYDHYDQARGLVPLVEPVGRPVLVTIMGIYRALLDEIVRRDFDVMSRRVRVPAWRKAAIAVGSFPQRFRGGPRGRATRLVP